MGTFAEDCADKFHFSREAQDAYAIGSLEGALRAEREGLFNAEIAAVRAPGGKSDIEIAIDEQPRKARPDKIPLLKPAFRKDGTVTPANASSISDGAAALVLMRQSQAEARELPIRARILGHASHAQEPGWFTTAPVPAVKKLLERLGWRVAEVDLWEINEAFAVVPMAAMVELDLPREKVNVHGGACALGHPIGASGARILVTLLHALEHYDLERGIATLCAGGGEGTAVALERL
jgi:acetyl-CoA C-acetyltransferase